MQRIPPRTAIVGEELQIPLVADALSVEFDFESDIADLKTRRLHPVLTSYSDGVAMFRWTPLGADIGEHQLRFLATSNGVAASQAVKVTVLAGADPITFREPVGEGTTLDLSLSECADVRVLVEDTSATEVVLGPGALWADGAELLQTDPLAGRLRFCPTPGQAQTIYPLSMVASDEFGAQAEKRYTIVLGQLALPPSPGPASCDDTPPSLTHTPRTDITISADLPLHVDVEDDQGVRSAVVYWGTDPSALAALPMIFVGETAQASRFAATLPNPVKNAPAGTKATVTYYIRASDTADGDPGCPPNVADTPTYSFTVTR